MKQSSYDPAALLIRSQCWLIEADAATSPAMRAFCLSEALRYEQMVQRSIEVPVIRVGPADAAATPRRARAFAATN